MTTIYEDQVECSVCGIENECVDISSTNKIGSSDLDMRPPEMQRSTMYTWVQRCPGCGYCASDLSTIYQGARDVMNGKEYKDQLNDPMYSELANSFLCQAILCRESKNFTGATLAFIHAAWVCDDSDHIEQARACRQKAVNMFTVAEEVGQKLAKKRSDNTTIIVDLLRRSGQMEQAQKVILARRGKSKKSIIARILAYETALIEKNDVGCHTMAEALIGANRP